MNAILSFETSGKTHPTTHRNPHFEYRKKAETLMPFRDIIVVLSDNDRKHVYIYCVGKVH